MSHLDNETFGWIAGAGNLQQVIQYLSDHPEVDPSYDNNSAIRAAILCGHHNIVEYLISVISLDRIEPISLPEESLVSDVSDVSKVNIWLYPQTMMLLQKDRLLTFLRERCNLIKEELMMKMWHPSRVEKMLLAGVDVEDM